MKFASDLCVKNFHSKYFIIKMINNLVNYKVFYNWDLLLV